MAEIKIEHTADGGREIVYRVRVYENEFYWLAIDGVTDYVVSQFRDYLSPVLEAYGQELIKAEKDEE